ncbi:MAG: EAL domain-containing protein [Treponema sp.]|nr:EAL domain-containing protein [Treponema sp.]
MSDDIENSEKIISSLKQALQQEVQYRNALISNAITFFDVNLSKDIIPNDFYYKRADGKYFSALEMVGLKAPCKFSLYIKRYVETVIIKEDEKKCLDFKNLRKKLLQFYKAGKKEYSIQFWTELETGRKLFALHRFLLTQSEDGDINALCILKDESESQLKLENAYQKELEQYAYFDPITKGYNYIKFKDKLKTYNRPGSIIALDIHSFKIINTVSGILKGDQVIKSIWDAMVNALDFDKNDIAGHINADQFIIYVPTFSEKVLVRKLKNISLAFSIISTEMEVPLIQPYFGISKWQPGKKIELAYSEAVAAKTNAQNQQNLNYAFFDEEDTIRLIREKSIVDSFDESLAKKEFKIWYQPKYNPVTRKLVGAEALVRWIKPDGSMISPADFIPLFEKNGMIRQFDEYIFRNVCWQLNEWLCSGKDICPISINLSRVSLYFENIVNVYKSISDDIGIDKSYLPIEITETAAITNSQIQAIADKFYTAGFKLHMDDFGAGYSSLASLNTMHFDTLKLDKSLIDFIGNFGGDRLLEHTILLAKELGMHVTAEGVENERQVAFLRNIGCDSIQGYYFSKPLPAEQFEKLLGKLKTQKKEDDFDHLNEYVSKFKSAVLRPPLYSFIVNLTENTFVEINGSNDWCNETKIDAKKFDAAVNLLAQNYISPEYKDAYRNFMSRQRMLEEFNGVPDTRIFTYTRKFRNETKPMGIMNHVFKIEDSDCIWMYFTVSMV